MNKRRKLIVAIGAGAFATPLACFAQQPPKKIARVGYLSAVAAAVDAPRVEAFRQRLRELGYTEGQNIIFYYRQEDANSGRLPGLAEELVRLNVDVLVAVSTPAAVAAKNATRTVPVVFTGVFDPVAAGLVDNLARPKENVTGLSNMISVLSAKRLELLKETVPKVSRIAVLWEPQNTSSAQQWQESQLAAKTLGLQLHSMRVNSADQYESAFKDAAKARSAALAVTLTPTFLSNQKQIAGLAIKYRWPSIYAYGSFVDAGGLMSYGPNPIDSYRRAASYVDKILKGAKPADLPVEQPTEFELIVNLKSAKQIGIAIPQSVLSRIHRVIE
jgi:putative ABC transport system substrate-binding protein